jgi:hypothetical protein
MNIPNVYRKALDGFIIPPRTFLQMCISAAQGTYSLFDESSRSDFIENLDQGTINEGVISQATAGPMIMLSLFHDMQNPLFKQNKFDVSEFLEGVGPALENFHNKAGALENQLHNINIGEEDKSSEEAKNQGEDGSKSEAHSVNDAMSDVSIPPLGGLFPEDVGSGVSKILNHDWMDDAKGDPESLAGQLSNMVSEELFQIHQVSSKTQFLLKNHARNIKFQEGSCSVNNVCLLSARTFLCREKEAEADVDTPGPRYEMLDSDAEDGGDEGKRVGVAAQMEVLYDVTQEFTIELAPAALDEETGEEVEKVKPETLQTTIVSVATLEGWLQGGPDGELRWRLALYRPAFEFPGIQQAY